MEKKNHLRKGIFALLVAAATLAGCSKDSDSNDTPTPPVQDPYKDWAIKPKIKEGEASYISFYIPTGGSTTIDFSLKGNGWMDINNNGVQDADEKTEVFDGSEESYTLQNQVFTFYGIINTLTVYSCGLKGIDVSHVPTLQELSTYGNELSELNVKENKALNSLAVFGSLIKKLDLRENNALTYLDVSTNLLEELNLSENKVITELYVSNNQLSALDLRENKSLTRLSVSNNQISTLDLRENKSLTRLNVSNNQLSTLLDLRANSQLKDVDLSGNKLSEEAILKTVESLPQREEASQGDIVLQTFRIVEGKQVVENNKPNEETLKKLGAKKWRAQFINKEGKLKEYNGNLNTPQETP